MKKSLPTKSISAKINPTLLVTWIMLFISAPFFSQMTIQGGATVINYSETTTIVPQKNNIEVGFTKKINTSKGIIKKSKKISTNFRITKKSKEKKVLKLPENQDKLTLVLYGTGNSARFSSSKEMMKFAVNQNNNLSLKFLPLQELIIIKKLETLYQAKNYYYNHYLELLNYSEVYSVRPPPSHFFI